MTTSIDVGERVTVTEDLALLRRYEKDAHNTDPARAVYCGERGRVVSTTTDGGVDIMFVDGAVHTFPIQCVKSQNPSKPTRNPPPPPPPAASAPVKTLPSATPEKGGVDDGGCEAAGSPAPHRHQDDDDDLLSKPLKFSSSPSPPPQPTNVAVATKTALPVVHSCTSEKTGGGIPTLRALFELNPNYRYRAKYSIANSSKISGIPRIAQNVDTPQKQPPVAAPQRRAASPMVVSRRAASPMPAPSSKSTVAAAPRSPMRRRPTEGTATTPNPVAASARPKLIRLFENGVYGDVDTDRVPFKSVTLRPNFKTLSAVSALFTRELQWNGQYRKVDRIYDAASGREISNLDDIADGDVLVATGGEKYVPPAHTTVLARILKENGSPSTSKPPQTRSRSPMAMAPPSSSAKPQPQQRRARTPQPQHRSKQQGDENTASSHTIRRAAAAEAPAFVNNSDRIESLLREITQLEGGLGATSIPSQFLISATTD
eukprot:PhM_4_TR2840/c0_g1_i1/m.20313